MFNLSILTENHYFEHVALNFISIIFFSQYSISLKFSLVIREIYEKIILELKISLTTEIFNIKPTCRIKFYAKPLIRHQWFNSHWIKSIFRNFSTDNILNAFPLPPTQKHNFKKPAINHPRQRTKPIRMHRGADERHKSEFESSRLAGLRRTFPALFAINRQWGQLRRPENVRRKLPIRWDVLVSS